MNDGQKTIADLAGVLRNRPEFYGMGKEDGERLADRIEELNRKSIKRCYEKVQESFTRSQKDCIFVRALVFLALCNLRKAVVQIEKMKKEHEWLNGLHFVLEARNAAQKAEIWFRENEEKV